MTSSPTRVAIIGASGYTGAELLRILVGHPRVKLTGVFAGTQAGKALAEVFPQFLGDPRVPTELLPFDADAIARTADTAFCALPHAASATSVAGLLERGLMVLDLSADFRLRHLASYETWYGGAHLAPELLPQAVYGLVERARARLVGARLIAVPGCYPTGAILALAPLFAAKLIRTDDLIVDAKSGASGAGRAPNASTQFAEMGEGLRAYQVGGRHRHTPEIEQELSAAAGETVRVSFVPHLLPVARGILTCAYATPRDLGQPAGAYYDALVRAYEGEPFVQVLPPGKLPDTSFVRGSNRAHVTAIYDQRAKRVIAMSAIDNLVKGAAGQAVQAFNVAAGWPETTGLEGVALFP